MRINILRNIKKLKICLEEEKYKTGEEIAIELAGQFRDLNSYPIEGETEST